MLWGVEGGAREILDHCVLEAGDEVKRLGVDVWESAGEVDIVGLRLVQAEIAESLFAGGDDGLHAVQLDVAASCCLDARERHVEARGLVFRRESGFPGELGSGVAGGLLLDLSERKERGVGSAVRSE